MPSLESDDDDDETCIPVEYITSPYASGKYDDLLEAYDDSSTNVSDLFAAGQCKH